MMAACSPLIEVDRVTRLIFTCAYSMPVSLLCIQLIHWRLAQMLSSSCGMDANTGCCGLRRITKVRQFQKLARMAEADGHLQQRIKQLLKLSKEKWDAACEHAKTAVQVTQIPISSV